VCCLEFTFLEQSAQWSVPIVRMKMNENKLHVLLLSMNQKRHVVVDRILFIVHNFPLRP
jgi:hypothetical protein